MSHRRSSQHGAHLRTIFRDTPWFEIYRNAPASTPPAQRITDIHIPLKLARGALTLMLARAPRA